MKTPNKPEMFKYSTILVDRLMNYKYVPSDTTTTVSTHPANSCDHGTGWFHNIPFGIFYKRIFICEKCFTVLDKTRKKII